MTFQPLHMIHITHSQVHRGVLKPCEFYERSTAQSTVLELVANRQPDTLCTEISKERRRSVTAEDFLVLR